VAKNSKKPKKSQKYRVFPMLSNITKRQIDKKTKEFRSMNKWDAIKQVMQRPNSVQNTSTSNVLYSELKWEEQGRNALFLNLDDIATIERGVCKVKFIPDNFLPFKSFMLCLPSGYEAHGIRPTGVLVSSFDSNAEWSSGVELMRKKINPEMPPVSDDASYRRNKGISISYRDTNEKDFTNLVLYDGNLKDVVNCKSFSEFMGVRTRMNKGGVNYFNQESLTTAEHQMQYTLFKLMMSLSMYIKAKPEALADGFPIKGGFSLSEPFAEPVRGKTVNVSTKHKSSPEEHHRGWFIRQLVAECYYRGEYKDLEPGSRMVFVDETTVNLKVASHNVQGEAAA
jgi:hypothetical protein